MTPGELEHLVGRRLGHYHLQTLLGARGQAVVYRALDLLQGRDLALYVVCPGASESAAFGERFRTAVARIAALKHPHILPAYEVGQDDIFSYVAVPIERESLHERFQREGILPPVDAARVMAQVAWALDALHGAGIAGLRLAMNNILLNSDNLALLADTSVAHGGTTDALVPRVATGLPMGVVQAMALGKSPPSTQSKVLDVYSLGSMLYELLTGMPPHSESSQEELASGMLTATLPEEPRTTRMWPELEEVVLIALTDEPRRGYATAREFAVAIRHAVARYDDGGAEGAPVQSLLNSHRTAPPPIRGDTGELQAKLHSPTSPPALSRPSRQSRPISRPITPRGLSTPPAPQSSPPSPTPSSTQWSPPSASAPPSPQSSPSSQAADDLPATTKLPRDAALDHPEPPRPPTPSRPITPSTHRPTQPPAISGNDEALIRILHPATGGPAPSGPRRPTSGPAPSGPRRPTSGPAPSSQQQHHPTAPPAPPAPPLAPSSPSAPPAHGRPTSPPGRLRVPSQPLRPSWSSYPSQPSIPPEMYADDNTGEFEALAAAYAIRSSTAMGTRVSIPEHEQPSPTTMAALSLRALAEAQAEPQPAPRTRRAKARLLLAALLGIALVIFCASGLLVIATGRAQSAPTPTPTTHPTPTATVIGSGPSFIGSALTNGTSRPYLDRRAPALASPSASTSAPAAAPAATPALRAETGLSAAPIASAGMSGTLEAANALGATAASGDALLVSPMLAATLTLTPAGGLCTGTQTITNPTSYRVSWFWRQLAIGGFVLPVTFRYALDGGAWTAGLPHDTALAAGATDTVSIAMPCDGNIYVLTLVDNLGHAVGFFMQSLR